EKLVECATDRPDVNSEVIGHAKDNFGCTIEAGDQVGSDLVFCRVRSGSEIANLEHIARFVDQNVIWLEVRVEDIAFAHETETEKHLLGIGSDSFQIDPNVTT